MTLSPSKLFTTGLICLAVLFSNTALAGPKAVIDSPEQAVVGDVIFSGMRSHGAVSYEWIFSDDAANPVTTASTTKTYSTVGEFSVKLTVVNATGTSASYTKFITILPTGASVTPLTSFTMSPPANTVTNNYIVGEMISFTSASRSQGNSTINNHWDFGELKNALANTNNKEIMPVQTPTLTGDGTNTLYATVNREFRAAGTYTVTLFSQVDFTPDPTPATATALTGVYQKTITVDPCPVGTTCLAAPKAIPVAKLYNDNCGRCHGVVDTVKDPVTKAVTGYLTTIVKGEHSLLVDTGAVPKPAFPKTLPVTAQSILAAYSIVTTKNGASEMLMAGVKVLTLTQAEQVVAFLSTLTLRANQTGAELYRAQCSRCHGTGSGGYGSYVLGTSVVIIKRGIATVPEMATVPASDAELALIVEFLDTSVPAVPPAIKAPLPKPLTGGGLYIMYCSYCHGNDGFGGPFVDESISGVGVSGSMILNEIEKNSSSNKMSAFNLLLLNKDLLPSDLDLIAASLANFAVTPRSDEDEDD